MHHLRIYLSPETWGYNWVDALNALSLTELIDVYHEYIPHTQIAQGDRVTVYSKSCTSYTGQVANVSNSQTWSMENSLKTMCYDVVRVGNSRPVNASCVQFLSPTEDADLMMSVASMMQNK